MLETVLVMRFFYEVWFGAPFVLVSPLVVSPLVAPLGGCRDENSDDDDGGILPFFSHNLDAVSTCGLSQVVARGMARRAA